MQLQNVFLIGPPGAGKTTVGKVIAKSLRLDFYDSDAEIEQLCGVNIAWIFDVEGEQGFRVREQDMLESLANKTGLLLATGGGAVLSDKNRALLASRGTVIYLKVSIEQELTRLKNDATHPVLYTKNKKAALEKLREKRDPLYEQIADFTIDTNGKSVKRITQTICDYLEKL